MPPLGFEAGQSVCEAPRRVVGELAQCEANLALLKIHLDKSGLDSFTPQARKLYKWHRETVIGEHGLMRASTAVTVPPQQLRPDWLRRLQLCREHGLDVLAVDLTHRDAAPGARAGHRTSLDNAQMGQG